MLHVINAAKERGIREVIVAYSSGKDSLAVLDLCFKHFERVAPYFMYILPGLSFQEVHLQYVEKRYSLEVIRVPDWRLCKLLRGSVARHPTQASASLPSVSWGDVENHIRSRTGLHWVASGESIYDSMNRRGMIVSSSSGVDIPRGHIYPVGFWKRREIESYLSHNQITIPCEYRVMTKGRSFGGILPDQIFDIKKHYPEDYERLKELFPLIETQAIRHELDQDERRRTKEHKISELRRSRDSSESDQECSLQSAGDHEVCESQADDLDQGS